MADEFMVRFGGRVAALRTDADMTQQQLADMAATSRSSIANLERGEQWTNGETLVRLAFALGTTVDDLLGRSNGDQHRFPWIELVKRVTASERANRALAAKSWEDHDVIAAVRHRGIADGLVMARDHHADVIAESKRAADTTEAT